MPAALALRVKQEKQIGRHQRFVEHATQVLGRPQTIYLTLFLVAAWIVVNLLAPTLALPVLDPPPFTRLQGVIGLAALVMTTMVLTTQNRQARHAEQRAHLDLEVNILAEQKVAKLIALVEELRRDMPNVHNRKDSMAEAMTRALDPQTVLSALEETTETPAATKNDEETDVRSGSRKPGSD